MSLERRHILYYYNVLNCVVCTARGSPHILAGVLESLVLMPGAGRRKLNVNVIKMGEELRIGVVVPSKYVERLRDLCPRLVRAHYVAIACS